MCVAWTYFLLIHLFPALSYFYWTDWGSPAKIERATLGGSFRQAIISTGLTTPNGLTLDYDERMLYWADADEYVFYFLNTQIMGREKHRHLTTFFFFQFRDKIERSTLTGEDRQVILHGVHFPYAITVYQQDIFWTDLAEKSVFRAQKDDGSGFTVLAKDLLQQPNDIHVYSPSKQEACSSFCQQFNGGCSHTCVSGRSNTAVHKFILNRKKKVVKSAKLLYKLCGGRSIWPRMPVSSQWEMVPGQQW